MVTGTGTLEKIKEAIEKHFSVLMSSVLGGDDVQDSLLRLAYLHSFITPPTTENPPKSLNAALLRVSHTDLPDGEAVQYAITSTHEQVKVLIEQLKATTTTKITGLIRKNNDAYKQNALQNLRRPDLQDALIKESSLGGLKEELQATVKKATSAFRSIVLTELSNSVGNASVDRIVDNHAEAETPTSDIFVYRIPVQDSATCRFCRKFYGDVGETPEIYRLSTLLNNGSNYGKPNSTWLPVVGSTHPNTRTSQIIEIPPGYIVLPGGNLSFVGSVEARVWLNARLK